MFATVDELLYLNGITPQPNVAYYDGFGAEDVSRISAFPPAGKPAQPRCDAPQHL